MRQPYIPLRIILGGVALAHVLIGLGGVIPAIPVSGVVKVVYGAALTVTPQIEHIVQMFGAYMLTVGLLAAIAAWQPAKSTFIIYGVSFLLLVRVIQRLFFAGQAESVFGISPVWYWVQTVVFFVIPVCLILLRPRASKTNHI